jgi:hypothetical protein
MRHVIIRHRDFKFRLSLVDLELINRPTPNNPVNSSVNSHLTASERRSRVIRVIILPPILDH